MVREYVCFCGWKTREADRMLTHWFDECPKRALGSDRLVRLIVTPATRSYEADYDGALPDMQRLERIIRQLQTFSELPVRRAVSPADLRELEKAVGLIDAIVFEEIEEGAHVDEV
jgi:hypothetical protein